MEVGLLIVILGVAAGVVAILLTLHRRRTPPELRGDWWTPFEREFRAYATQAARQRGRHRGERA